MSHPLQRTVTNVLQHISQRLRHSALNLKQITFGIKTNLCIMFFMAREEECDCSEMNSIFSVPSVSSDINQNIYIRQTDKREKLVSIKNLRFSAVCRLNPASVEPSCIDGSKLISHLIKVWSTKSPFFKKNKQTPNVVKLCI